jgi:nitrite reductase/ring-hydroxylating ferredoxin subunit
MVSQKMVFIANIKEIPVGESNTFIYPEGDKEGTKKPGIIIHLEGGFYAYEGLCTHMHAELKWNKYTGKIWCTMHDGMYDPQTGYPFMGMPKDPLKKLKIQIEENGDIYLVI